MAQKPLPHGSLPLYIINAPIVERFDYDSNNNLIYHGIAIPGSATSAAVWFIEKYTYVNQNGGFVVTAHELANGTDLANNIWDNRPSLSYS